MQVELTRKFGKQVAKCKDPKIRHKLYLIINEISDSSDISRVKNIKKLKGHHSFYRIRLQDYRIGLVLQGDKVILAAFDHRSDIYKFFHKRLIHMLNRGALNSSDLTGLANLSGLTQQFRVPVSR